MSPAVLISPHYLSNRVWTITHYKLIMENGGSKIIKKIIWLEENSSSHHFGHGMVCVIEAVEMIVNKEDQMTRSGNRDTIQFKFE